MSVHRDDKRAFGEHLTPIQIFKKYILPNIKSHLKNYVWVDLFAGEGNLILPILELIPMKQRASFFERHMFLFDTQKKQVELAISNAVNLGVPTDVANNNIQQRDTLRDYPDFLLSLDKPIFHITNPPYLYIGYIVKHKRTQKYLDYFTGCNKGYQDLYQLALMNDLRHNICNMIYVIPSNFLFGSSVSNKIRMDFLKHYLIQKAVIFEQRIFEHTGTNVIICFFKRKQQPRHESLRFEGVKINNGTMKKIYTLNPNSHYRTGDEFNQFIRTFQTEKPLRVKFYLTTEEIEANRGDHEVEVIDANAFNGNQYMKMTIRVNKELCEKIKANPLFIRTVDTGSVQGRVGLYCVQDVFGVDGILVTKAKYRTHPIQVFIEPDLKIDDLVLLRDYFNLLLEHFRQETDSEFMTTYKYSNSKYTRKFFGLTQTRKLIETFPILSITDDEQNHLVRLIQKRNTDELIQFVMAINEIGKLDNWI